MKYTLLILLGILALYSCKKSNSDNVQRSVSLKTIVVYNPTAATYRTLNIQTFDYGSDGRLLSYTDKAIDSIVSGGVAGVSYETRIFAFSYSGSTNLPDSYSLTDSNYNSSASNLMVLHEKAGFVYDAQNRLTANTFDIPNSTSSLYAYSGDTVLFMEKIPGSPLPIHGLPLMIIENGNLARSYGKIYTYSSVPNPLQNTAIARTYAPIFYGGLIGISPSYGLPVDFISRGLPSSLNDGQGNIARFNWTTDSKGRVIQGTATNLYPFDPGLNGTVYITFNY